MPDYLDLLTTRLLSSVLQACEEMALPGGKPPTVVDVGSTVQGALPTPGEILPLAIMVVLFVGTAAWIMARESVRKARQASGRVVAGSPSEAFG